MQCPSDAWVRVPAVWRAVERRGELRKLRSALERSWTNYLESLSQNTRQLKYLRAVLARSWLLPDA